MGIDLAKMKAKRDALESRGNGKSVFGALKMESKRSELYLRLTGILSRNIGFTTT